MKSGLLLERPLCTLDLETTGRNPDRDRIIQIGIEMEYPNGRETAWRTFIDPEMAIPAEIVQAIKISDADVAGAPTFRSLAATLARKLTDVDFAGYNVRDFDLKFLRAEMRRADVDWDWERDGAAVVDVQKIYFIYNPRRLNDAYKEYVDPAGFEGAHDAGNDVAATVAVLAAQIARHDLPRVPKDLEAICFPSRADAVDKAGKVVWRNQEACLGFGKFDGTPLKDVDRGYLRFMLRSDFPADTKRIIEDATIGVYPKWIPRG